MIELKYLKDDPDNCRIYYKSVTGNLYCTVDGIMHACTTQGEPEYPIKEFEVIE